MYVGNGDQKWDRAAQHMREREPQRAPREKVIVSGGSDRGVVCGTPKRTDVLDAKNNKEKHDSNLTCIRFIN